MLKISVQGFRGERFVSICDISCRDATLVDRRIPWQLSGIGNIVDYHSGWESSCFRCKSIAHRGSRQNRAKSFDSDWPIFSGSVRTCALLWDDRRRIVVFLRISTLTWPMQPRWQHHYRLEGWQPMPPSVFPLPCFGQKRFIFLAVPRISGILYSCNGALNAFPLLEYYHLSKLWIWSRSLAVTAEFCITGWTIKKWHRLCRDISATYVKYDLHTLMFYISTCETLNKQNNCTRYKK